MFILKCLLYIYIIIKIEKYIKCILFFFEINFFYKKNYNLRIIYVAGKNKKKKKVER